MAPEFHPDKYFRKRLGPYKQKIEAIFSRLTLAHDVLTSKQRRAEYDAYLDQISRNQAMAALLEQPPEEIASVVSAVDEAAMAAAATNTGPGRVPDYEPSPESVRMRREALARKLIGGGGNRSAFGSAPPAASASPTTQGGTMPPPASAYASGDALRVRYDTARSELRRVQVERYLHSAKIALERNDLAVAVNAYRLAASLAPDDAEIQRKSADVQQLAATTLAEGYVKQAEYEASQGRWLEASLSYAKVCSGRPDDARAHERVAFATLQAGSNVRRAVEYARKAVKLIPTMPEYRLTLARAYAAAGLETSARAELDRAAEIPTNDVKIRESIAQLRAQLEKGA
jgi:tetratricopeptide (TPR) repeat protein